ncbi:Syntaxin-51 [Glycine soja]
MYKENARENDTENDVVVNDGDDWWVAPYASSHPSPSAPSLNDIASITPFLFLTVTAVVASQKRVPMASSSDSWVKEYNEALKLADDISGMISEQSSFPASGPETQHHSSAIRRKITILGTRLDSLQSLLSEKEMNRRKDMLSNLRSKVNQMASTLNMSNFANRDSLLGPERKPDAMTRMVGLDNNGLVGLQRQIMKEQDDGLEQLEETVASTKHIALAVNEELDLHTRLIDDLDQHVDVTDSRLRRVQKNLAVLNKRTKGGCSCMCMLLSVVGIVALIVVIWLLVKYL